MSIFSHPSPMIDINLNKSSRVSKMFIEVIRKILPFLAVLAILFSSVLSFPDVHAGEGASFAHAADHIYAHGADHFDTNDATPDHDGQDHSATHHHNCSFILAGSSVPLRSPFWRSDNLRAPLATSSLASRAPPVLIQPPKA